MNIRSVNRTEKKRGDSQLGISLREMKNKEKITRKNEEEGLSNATEPRCMKR